MILVFVLSIGIGIVIGFGIGIGICIGIGIRIVSKTLDRNKFHSVIFRSYLFLELICIFL